MSYLVKAIIQPKTANEYFFEIEKEKEFLFVSHTMKTVVIA
jgi:hypothetical protein